MDHMSVADIRRVRAAYVGRCPSPPRPLTCQPIPSPVSLSVGIPVSSYAAPPPSAHSPVSSYKRTQPRQLEH
eukprot:7391731-Prymnesium_polylepis.1